MGRLQVHPRRTRPVRLGAIQTAVHPRVGRLCPDPQRIRGQAPAHLSQPQHRWPPGIRAARRGPPANPGQVTTESRSPAGRSGRPRDPRALSRPDPNRALPFAPRLRTSPHDGWSSRSQESVPKNGTIRLPLTRADSWSSNGPQTYVLSRSSRAAVRSRPRAKPREEISRAASRAVW